LKLFFQEDRYLSIENDCIPLIPNALDSHHEDLHEKRVRESSLGA
jgi:hypothetical protein